MYLIQNTKNERTACSLLRLLVSGELFYELALTRTKSRWEWCRRWSWPLCPHCGNGNKSPNSATVTEDGDCRRKRRLSPSGLNVYRLVVGHFG